MRLGQPGNQRKQNIDMKRDTSTAILDNVPGYMDHLRKEAIEIRLHPRKFNRDGIKISAGSDTR
jgi:hypothetical protein